MRWVERSCYPIRLFQFPLALLIAGQTPIVWSVACVAVALTVVVPQILILTLSILLTVVLAPLFLSCRFCFQSEWRWFRQHRWSLWSWLGILLVGMALALLGVALAADEGENVSPERSTALSAAPARGPKGNPQGTS